MCVNLIIFYNNKMTCQLTILINKLKTYSSFDRPRTLYFISDYDAFIICLENINKMVGLKRLKESLAKQIKGFIVNYWKYGTPVFGEKLHTLIYGPPGTGKTMLGKYLAELWTVSGCLGSTSQDEKGSEDMQTDDVLTQFSRAVENVANGPLNNFYPSSRPKRYNNSQIDIIINLLNKLNKDVRPKHNSLSINVNQRFRYIKRLVRELRGNDVPLPVSVPQPGFRGVFEASNSKGKLPILVVTSSKEVDIKKNNFRVITRGDLIGKYQGHTAQKVRALLNEVNRGVVMIDEAYNLSVGENDSYGEEALTEINNYMSANPDKIIFIFAGYRDKIEKSILKVQPGLARRFNWTIDIDDYSSSELSTIFQVQLSDDDWIIDDKLKIEIDEFFKKNHKNFPYYGGDTEKLALYVKEEITQTLWLTALESSECNYPPINMKIIEDAYKNFLSNSVVEKEKEDAKKRFEMVSHMYV
jgi:Cdc6-like AAA superfamily ATPase